MTYQPAHDLNHIQHVNPGHRYSCHSSPRPRHETPPYKIRDGYNEDGTVRFVWHHTEWQPVPCGHTWGYSDPACRECPWRNA